MRKTLIVLALLWPLPALGQTGLIPADIGARVASAYVEPAVDGFAGATAGLAKAAEALCADPSAPTLAAAKDGFAATVTAWGRLSVLRFGPLVAENRFESIFFWPDPRGVTLKQVQAALADADASVTDAAQLSGKSVALQNLFALDFLLAGSGAEALADGSAPHRCAYLAAAAQVLENHAEAIAAEWDASTPIGASFRMPGPDGYFRSPEEVTAELLKATRTSVEYASSAELLPALGETLAEAHGRRAPLWRSDLTFALVGAQLSGLVDLLDATGLGESLTGTYLTPFTNLHSDLKQAAGALAAIAVPAETAFGDEGARKRLDYARLLLGYAETTISGDLVAALGLTMGFNALDGD